MVAVVFRLRPIGLAELQILILSDPDARHGTVVVLELGRYPHDLRIEVANALRRPGGHLELDIGDAKRDAPEAGGVRLIAAQPIAPGACRLDVVVVLTEGE